MDFIGSLIGIYFGVGALYGLYDVYEKYRSPVQPSTGNALRMFVGDVFLWPLRLYRLWQTRQGK